MIIQAKERLTNQKDRDSEIVIFESLSLCLNFNEWIRC